MNTASAALTAATSKGLQQPMAALLMGASGFAGLGYQIVWTQQCALWLGHESAAVLAVVAAFFGGLALGARALGPRIESSAQPARAYAACEAVIAAWALVLLVLMAPFSAAALRLMGEQPQPLWQGAVAFAGNFLLLLPATAAMGATLPAMARVLGRLQAGGQPIAALYAANTAGAVAGVLAAAFWLVPQWGLMRTAALCAVLNLLCAAAAWLLFANQTALAAAAPSSTDTDAARARTLRWQLAATGLLGIGHEVLVVRVLSQVAEDTVYTFALLLAVYLLFTALGAAAWQRWGRQDAAAGDRLLATPATDRLLALLTSACLLGTASLWGAEAAQAWCAQQFGRSLPAALAGEALLAAAAFALPTLVMGALFSHLCSRAEAAGIGFARALAVNTLGAAFAPMLFGVLLAPAVGPKFALLLVAAGYLLLVSRAAWRHVGTLLPAAAAATLAFAAPPLAFVDVPEGGHIVSQVDGAMAAVSVTEDADGVRRLRINNRQQEGSSATRYFDARQALLPLLLHPAPQRALFLGLGTGVTAAAAAEPGLQVDAAELLPEVIAAARLFTPESQARIVAADARRFVRAGTQRYDVIVSDNFHPARSGSASLYTVEHFAAVRERLNGADAVFCQWLPLHQMDIDTLRSIVKSFNTAFPGGYAMLATNSLLTPTLGLVGRAGGGPNGAPNGARFQMPALAQRLATADIRQRLQPLGLSDPLSLLGGFVAGPRSLQQWAAEAPSNTDDRPVVAYLAPRLTYTQAPAEPGAPGTAAADRLLTLLTELAIAPAELLAPSTATATATDTDTATNATTNTATDARWRARVAAYWRARDRYIASGRHVQPVADARQMLQQVQAPLLAVLRISPDFSPAYDPLLRLALSLGRSDPEAARQLLAELALLAPQRPEAAHALSHPIGVGH